MIPGHCEKGQAELKIFQVVFFFFNENLQYLASVFIAGFCLEDCDVASQTWPSPSRLKVRASPTGSQPPCTHTVLCRR